MSTSLTPQEPKKDHPMLWLIFAAVTVMMLISNSHQFFVWLWWGSLVVAFVGNPTSRAKAVAFAERREEQKTARKVAKREAKNTQHIYHHYADKPTDRDQHPGA